MRKEEIATLVDKGRKLKEKIDSLELDLEKVKKTLREQAKTKKVDFFLGEKHFARVSPQTFNEVDPEDLYETMKKAGMEKEYFDCVKILIGKAKAAIGETTLDTITTSDVVPYKKVSFLKNIPKELTSKK